MLMSWFARFLGRRNHTPPVPPPAAERVGDLIRRGGGMRPFELTDVPADYLERLRAVCRADPNIRALWLAWITSVDEADELLTVLQLDHRDESWVRRFITHVDALGGPRCVASMPIAAPTDEPFYRRTDAA